MSRRQPASDPAGSLADLGRRAQAGSACALDRLMGRLEGPVYRYLVTRLLAAPDAEDLARDLCQEALIRATTSIGRCTFASDGRLVAWMLTIARNVLLDHLREVRGRDEVRGDDWVRTMAAGLQPGDDAPPPRPLETFAAEALAEVSEGTAELLRLRLMSGSSWKEVADVLGIAESAAKRRFQRAQATLRRQILARVEALPPEARRAALRRLLSPDVAPRADGAAIRSPDTEPGRAAASGRQPPSSRPSETPE
ncbi:MAG TPA: sigma-70 family RNA polymerase sigma factor [Longimicrobium sp.]